MFWQPPGVILNVCVSTQPMCCIMVHILYVKDIRWLWNLTFGFFQWHPIPMSRRGPSGCSLGHFWGPSGHSLATHLLLTCYSLAAHWPHVGHQGLNNYKKGSKGCVGKGMFGKFLPVPTWRRPMCVFHLNTICFEGSEGPQECDI